MGVIKSENWDMEGEGVEPALDTCIRKKMPPIEYLQKCDSLPFWDNVIFACLTILILNWVTTKMVASMSDPNRDAGDRSGGGVPN